MCRQVVRSCLGVLDALLPGVGERPNFVALDALGIHAAHDLAIERRARLASIDQQLAQGVGAHIGLPLILLAVLNLEKWPRAWKDRERSAAVTPSG